ncbi:MAG: inosine/xanthosine triphosphatase [Acidilobus sp.]
MPEGPRVVFLGSRNPVKVSGVRKAYERFYGSVEVRPVEVTGLPSQPVGLRETVELACRRASMAGSGGERVGVEAGIFRESGRWFVTNVTCIVRGRRTYVGLSPSFYIPRWLALMAMGSELDEALEKVTGLSDLGSSSGAIGLLSGGRVVREDLVYWATLMALSAAEGLSLLMQSSRRFRQRP